MDDSRLSNMLFLAGMASLAMPGCSSTAGPEDGGIARPAGNPLDGGNGLTDGQPDRPDGTPDRGGGDSPGGERDPCLEYATREFECVGSYYGYGLDYFRAECEALLNYIVSYIGEGCLAAYEEVLVCVAEQDCNSLGCGSERAASDAACGFDDFPDTGG